LLLSFRPVPYYYQPSAPYSPYSQLGDMYEAKLGLNRHEVLWLNKFYPPVHAFMQVEAAREATVRLFVAVMNQLETRCKAIGSTLPKQIRKLADATEEYDQVYNHLNYQYISRNMAGHKVGAAIFLTIFHHCENAVRRRFDFKELDASVYFSELNDPDQQFNLYFGDVLPALLAPLAQALPPPDEALEQALNLADQKRWQPRFEQLLRLLPASPAHFEEAVYALGQQNERNPSVAGIFQQAAWQLGAAGGAATVRLYVHYLYHGSQRYPFKPKPLLKRMQKALFPQPEHLPRFEALAQELLRTRDLAAALAAVPGIYYKERRKIELNPTAVQTARHQHAGTVELLNEYLQDTPETPAALPPPPAEATETVEIELPPTVPVAGATFAAGLSASQQALLMLFAGHQLALPQAAAEAFARQHGALRNQLIDSLNEACYDLLNDVLIEESGDDYIIYESYYQQLTTA